jgi:hypothetical protein
LHNSLSTLKNTDPKKMIQHFFLQAVNYEFSTESEVRSGIFKRIIDLALNRPLNNSIRQRSADILKKVYPSSIKWSSFRLADIRNIIVFTVFKHSRVTMETYFERYSSPPGTEEQNKTYSLIAHGNAIGEAGNLLVLETIILSMHILKRLFLVSDFLKGTMVELTPEKLNWIGPMWASHVERNSLSDLVWNLFLDIWYYMK